MARYRGLRVWLAVFALTLLAAAGAAEIALRRSAPTVVRIDPESGDDAVSVAGPEALFRYTNSGKRLIEGATVVVRNHRLSHRDVEISINSLGFRDQEMPLAKPPDELRILVLGDSITWGDYLPAEEVYVERIEDTLQQRHPTRTVQVINAGVGDIGLKEELDILKEKGLALSPDIVVLQFYLNDSRPPWGFPEELTRPGWLRRHSALARHLYERLKLRSWLREQGEGRFQWIPLTRSLDWDRDREAFLTLAENARFDWGAAWQASSWNELAPHFNELAAIAREQSFAVVLVAFPVLFQIEAEFLEDEPQRRLEEIAHVHQFHYLDLLPLLRSRRVPGMFFDQCHPAAPTNDLIGRYIALALDSLLTPDLGSEWDNGSGYDGRQ